jgi:transcriptional regulator with XRE-family HTH domain
MEPREALDKTFNYFELKASEVAKTSGVDAQELSRYRRGHKDMGSLRLFKIIETLPLNAKMYFYNLCLFGESASFEIGRAAQGR